MPTMPEILRYLYAKHVFFHTGCDRSISQYLQTFARFVKLVKLCRTCVACMLISFLCILSGGLMSMFPYLYIKSKVAHVTCLFF